VRPPGGRATRFLAQRNPRLDARPVDRHRLALVIIVFLYQPVKVEGTSMAPLLSDQERISLTSLSTDSSPFSAVMWCVLVSLDHSKSFIKRVVGLPERLLKFDKAPCTSTGRLCRSPMFRRSTRT